MNLQNKITNDELLELINVINIKIDNQNTNVNIENKMNYKIKNIVFV